MTNLPSQRIGIGYDIHRLEPGEGIMLGGVRVPCPFNAVAHSDGDVVLHAVSDAILGALAAGDIGEHFPDTDEQWKDADSSELLKHLLALPEIAAWNIGNIDVNIIAQKPRIGAHKAAIRARLANIVNLPIERVSIKARTNELCDAVGRCEAIQAQAVVMLFQ